MVLFGRTGCHLCDEAREVVRSVADEAGVPWHEVDIDTLGPASALRDELAELVPVVQVDGVRQGYWRIDAGRLRRALARGVATA